MHNFYHLRHLYHFQEEEQIPSPALIYYRDILQNNTKTAIACAGSPGRLWPHVKSHKSKDFTQMQAEMGITQFKCATIAEAEMVAQTAAKRIFIAYPLVGPNIGRFIRLILSYPDKEFFALGDNLDALRTLGHAAEEQHLRIRCLVDVNTGMNRTGVPFECLFDFYCQLAQIPGLTPMGFHCYDGDRHEQDSTKREENVQKTIAQIDTVQDKLQKKGLSCPIMILGGSPTFPCYSHIYPLTDDHCSSADNGSSNPDSSRFFSPGTVFIYDIGYTAQFPDLHYVPGAAILSRVISHPRDGWFTLDAGYKAISAEQKICGILLGLAHAKPEFQSEEHWTFSMEEGFADEVPAIGTVLYILPWHICPTSALYEKAYVVSDGHLHTEWPITARNRQLNI